MTAPTRTRVGGGAGEWLSALTPLLDVLAPDPGMVKGGGTAGCPSEAGTASTCGEIPLVASAALARDVTVEADADAMASRATDRAATAG